jgi:pimeloyl-ACP methyl ester carboxylesterase
VVDTGGDLARPERADVVGWPTLRSLTLCDGAVHIDLAKLSWPQVVLRHPTFGPMLGRLGSKSFMGRRLRKTLANPAGFRDDDIDFLWSCYDGWDRAVLAVISRYTFERSRFARRWIGALERLDVPTHVLWGHDDPIAVPAIAEALAGEIPGARLQWLEGVAHYPMVEAPEVWAASVLEFFTGLDSMARA